MKKKKPVEVEQYCIKVSCWTRRANTNTSTFNVKHFKKLFFSVNYSIKSNASLSKRCKHDKRFVAMTIKCLTGTQSYWLKRCPSFFKRMLPLNLNQKF